MLAYITGTVDQELSLRNEYLSAENRILRAQIKGRLLLSDPEKAKLAEIAHRLGRKALKEVAAAAKPDTLLAWYRFWLRYSTRHHDESEPARHEGPLRSELDFHVNRQAASEIQGSARKLNMLDEKIDDLGDLLRQKFTRF